MFPIFVAIIQKHIDMNQHKTYHPCPIQTEGINLPEDIIMLSERIAKNVHEVWAAARIAEGWTWGEKRDDTLKQHPCIVPYDELPEIEKQYDRETAMQTLKVIMKLGYIIKKDK